VTTIDSRVTRRAFLLGVGAAVGATALSLRASDAAAQVAADAVRIGIRGGNGNLEQASVEVSGDSAYVIRPASGEGDPLRLEGSQIATLAPEGEGVRVRAGDQARTFGGPVHVVSAEAGAPVLQVVNGKGYPYRGRFEVRASTPGERVVLLNVVALDQYVLGVVTKELSPSFGIEPLRAQAIAARTYVLARRATGAHKDIAADACDSQHCQVYAGMVAEHPAGEGAVERTKGLVLLRGGKVFEPLYSSACGGHTEGIVKLYGGGDDDEPVPDGEVPPGVNLATDLGASVFFKGAWDSNCAGSSRYRWSYTWTREELEATVAAGLRRYAGTSTLSSSASEDKVGTLANVAVGERGPSGRALSLKLEGAGVEWTVKRDWGIRNFLKTPEGDPLPSSAFAIEQARGADGRIARLTVYGAGWGHGGGMCQWGTRGLAARGMAYDAILGHYYPSAELGKA
jgi:stage II sporulation protein D